MAHQFRFAASSNSGGVVRRNGQTSEMLLATRGVARTVAPCAAVLLGKIDAGSGGFVVAA